MQPGVLRHARSLACTNATLTAIATCSATRDHALRITPATNAAPCARSALARDSFEQQPRQQCRKHAEGGARSAPYTISFDALEPWDARVGAAAVVAASASRCDAAGIRLR